MSGAPKPTILERYSKAICHLHYAAEQRRLGLIFGSGISEEISLPNWKKLLRALESALGYPTDENVPQSYRAEQLFQYFKAQHQRSLTGSDRTTVEVAIGVDWCKFVSDELYRKYIAPDGQPQRQSYASAIANHPYLSKLAALASKSLPLVVSHNFDDAFERALDADPVASTKEENRRYNTFWRPQPFLRPQVINIYHPNGYKPFGAVNKGSENIILTEGNFADHLANTNNIESNFLLRHLADRTCLILGHSLSDGTLKNALRLHANQRPGHVNYYVHWDLGGEDALAQERREAIREANFATYNLVTIFANSKEIGELARLVASSASDLRWELAGAKIEPRYVYYISGAVSAGKSTVLGHLRDLATVEEFPNRMPTEMNKKSTDLVKAEGDQIDTKLEPAIWKKNDEITNVQIGIVAVDRAPMDFLAFPEKPDEKISDIAKARTKKVLTRFEQNGFKELCVGHVVVLSTDRKVMFERQIQKGRIDLSKDDESSYIEYLRRQSDLMVEVYCKPPGNGSLVSTDPCSVANSVKDVARVIHLEAYKPFPFAQRLNDLMAEGGVDETKP